MLLKPGSRAIEAHYERIGISAQVFPGEFPGLYRTRFLRDRDPLISIIIPNKDHIDDLKRCMNAIDSKSTYKNYEYVIVENNSTDPATFQYYKDLEKENPKARVVYWESVHLISQRSITLGQSMQEENISCF